MDAGAPRKGPTAGEESAGGHAVGLASHRSNPVEAAAEPTPSSNAFENVLAAVNELSNHDSVVYDDHQGKVPLQIKCVANKGLRKIIVHIRYGRQSRTHIEATFEPDREGHVIGYVDKGTGVRKTRTGLTVSELKRPVLSRMLLSVRSFLPELAQKLVLNPEVMGALVKFEAGLSRKATAAAEPREEREVGVGDMYSTLVDQAAKARGKDNVGTFKVGPHTFKITLVDGKSFQQETVFIQCWNADVPGDSTKPMGSYGIIFTASPSRRGADVRVVRYNGHNRIDAEHDFLLMFKHSFTDTLKEIVRKLHEEDHHLEARGIYMFRTPEQAAHAAAEPETDQQETNDAVMHRIIAAIEYDAGQRLNFGEQYNGRRMRVSLHRLGLNINRLVELLVSVDVTGENTRDTDWYLSIQQAHHGAPWTYWIRDRAPRFQIHREVAHGDASVLVKALRAINDVHGHELLQLVAKFCAHVVTTAYERDSAKHHVQAAAEPEHGTFLYNEARRIKSGRQSSKLVEIGGIPFNVMFLHGVLHEVEARLVFEADLNFDDDYESEEEIKFEVFVSPEPCTTNETLKCYAVRRRGLRGSDRRTVDLDVTVKQVETWNASKLVAFVTKYLNAHAEQLRKAFILPEAGAGTAQAAAEPRDASTPWLKLTTALREPAEITLHDHKGTYSVDAFTVKSAAETAEKQTIHFFIKGPGITVGEGYFTTLAGRVYFGKYGEAGTPRVPVIVPSRGRPELALVHMLIQAKLLPATVRLHSGITQAAAEPGNEASVWMRFTKAFEYDMELKLQDGGKVYNVDAFTPFTSDDHPERRSVSVVVTMPAISHGRLQPAVEGEFKFLDGNITFREYNKKEKLIPIVMPTAGPKATLVHMLRQAGVLPHSVSTAAAEPSKYASDAMRLYAELVAFAKKNKPLCVTVQGRDLTISTSLGNHDASVRIFVHEGHPKRLFVEDELVHAVIQQFPNGDEDEPQDGPTLFADVYSGFKATGGPDLRGMDLAGDLKHALGHLVNYVIRSRFKLKRTVEAAVEPESAPDMCEFMGFTVRNDMRVRFMRGFDVTIAGTPVHIQADSSGRIEISFRNPFSLMYLTYRNNLDHDAPKLFLAFGTKMLAEASFKAIPDLKHLLSFFLPKAVAFYKRNTKAQKAQAAAEPHTPAKDHAFQDLLRKTPETELVTLHGLQKAKTFSAGGFQVRIAHTLAPVPYIYVAIRKSDADLWQEARLYNEHDGKVMTRMTIRFDRRVVEHAYKLTGCDTGTELLQEAIKYLRAELQDYVRAEAAAAETKAEAATEPPVADASRVFESMRDLERRAGDNSIASKTINGLKYSFTGGGEDDFGDEYIRGYVSLPASPAHTATFGSTSLDLAYVKLWLRHSFRTGNDEICIVIERVEEFTVKTADIREIILPDPKSAKDVIAQIINTVAARIKPRKLKYGK